MLGGSGELWGAGVGAGSPFPGRRKKSGRRTRGAHVQGIPRVSPGFAME